MKNLTVDRKVVNRLVWLHVSRILLLIIFINNYFLDHYHMTMRSNKEHLFWEMSVQCRQIIRNLSAEPGKMNVSSLRSWVTLMTNIGFGRSRNSISKHLFFIYSK